LIQNLAELNTVADSAGFGVVPGGFTRYMWQEEGGLFEEDYE